VTKRLSNFPFAKILLETLRGLACSDRAYLPSRIFPVRNPVPAEFTTAPIDHLAAQAAPLRVALRVIERLSNPLMNMIPKSAPCSAASVPSPSRRWLASLLLPLFAAGLLPASLTAQTITSAVPNLISYQGKVTNSSGALVGAGTPVNRTVIFRIWSHQSNSTINDLVYSEQQTVTISEGEFSVLIGQGSAVTGTPLGYSESTKGTPTVTLASAAVFGGATRYLGVTIDDGTAAADPEVSPRQQLVTSAFAMRAKFAETVGSNGNSTMVVNDAGNVGIGQATPGFPLNFASTLGDKISLFGNSGTHYGFGIQSGLLQVHTSGVGEDVAFGYGTSAVMTETMRIKGNGNVGIGTNNPTAKLDVNGIVNVFDGGSKSYPAGIATEVGSQTVNFGINDSRFGTQNTAQAGGFMRVDARGTTFGGPVFQFFTRAANAASPSTSMVIDASGNVGIGNSAPTAKLHVNGSISSTALSTGSLSLSGPLQASGAVTTHTQGAYLEWNKDGSSGMTYHLNQRGAGTGGHVFGDVDTGNTITEAVRIAGGSVKVTSAAGTQSLSITPGQLNGTTDATAATLDLPGTGTLSVWDNFVVSGNVGVGTTAPGFPLSFPNSLGDKIALWGSTGNHYGFGIQGSLLQIHTDSSGADIAFGYGTSAALTETMRIKGNGNVGIGLNDPKAPLHVRRADSFTNSPMYTRKAGSDTAYGVYLGANGALMYTDGASASYGDNETIKYGNLAAIFNGEVISYGGYWMGNAVTYSDARAKTVLGSSDSARDLSLLRDLKIRDFTWIDRTMDDHRPNKKLIAQEVEQVFPQAVRRTPRPMPIPNIYQVAEKIEFVAARKELRVTVGKAHDLKVGDSVDIATDETPVEEMKVTEVSSEREFTVSCEKAPKSIFVYGKYVSDFRAVDYDAIAMLNVSATQELARQVDALRASEARNAELAKRVAELEAKDRARDAKLASIEKLLQANQTVMASPAKTTSNNGQE
jgi:hypothetical protein